MIRVDNLKETVDDILNIENRGQVSPSEFNHFLSQANNQLFEQYFKDLAHMAVNPKGMVTSQGYSDLMSNINEKINIFSAIADTNTVITEGGESATASVEGGFDGEITYNTPAGRFILPVDLYRLDTIEYKNANNISVLVEEIEKKELAYVQNSPLSCPSETFPKYIRINNDVKVLPRTIEQIQAYYIRRPVTPVWNYIEVQAGVPLYNSATSVDCELHHSDEYRLIQVILGYAGISIDQSDIAQFALGLQSNDESTTKR